MATSNLAAGPEWAYLAPLTTNYGVLTDLDSLFVNVVVERKDPKPSSQTKVLNLQTLISRQGHLYGPHDVTRFSYSRFRDLTETWDLELFFYEGAHKHGVAIPDEAAFQRLLLAVRHLGLGGPRSPGGRVIAPPVMKFFARPKPPPELPPWQVALAWVLLLIGFVGLLFVVVAISFLLKEFGPGPVIVWFFVLSFIVNDLLKRGKKDEKKPIPTGGARTA